MRPLPATLALPGHGRPFEGLAERAEELRIHHEERSALIHDIIAGRKNSADGLTAYTVAGRLFGERLRSPDDWRFAIAETLAHLEYLRCAGHTTREERAGMHTYTA